MSNKPLNIGEEARVQMPMKTVASLIVLVAMGVFAYTELTARLVSLETSRELFENDLLKKSEQVPTDQEQHFLIEDLYKSVEKMEETQEMNMTNKVNRNPTLKRNENFNLLVSKCEGVIPTRVEEERPKEKNTWKGMKKDYLKENPDAKTMDNTTLKIPPKDYILPLPKPKVNND